jgi:hypothetical protein
MQAAEHTDTLNELFLEHDEKGLTAWALVSIIEQHTDIGDIIGVG